MMLSRAIEACASVFRLWENGGLCTEDRAVARLSSTAALGAKASWGWPGALAEAFRSMDALLGCPPTILSSSLLKMEVREWSRGDEAYKDCGLKQLLGKLRVEPGPAYCFAPEGRPISAAN